MQGSDPCIQETPHFRIHYRAWSFAEQHLASIDQRLEQAYGIFASLLNGEGHNAGRIDVYLSEVLADPQQPGVAPTSPGYTGAGEIHEVYRADAPGNDLERLLLQVLLVNAAGNDRALPPLIVDGLLGYVLLHSATPPASPALYEQASGAGDALPDLDDTSPGEEGLTELAQAKAQRKLPSLARLLAGPTPRTETIYYSAAASFVDFLVRTYGQKRFQEFVRQLQANTVEGAVRAAYGPTLSQLDKTWRKTLTIARPGSIARFIKLLAPYLRPHRLQVSETIIYLACSVAFSVGMARLQGILIDTALLPRDLHAFLVIMGILAGAFILISLIMLRQSYLSAYVSESVLRAMRLRLFALIQRLHPGFFQAMSTGDILSRITNDLDEIEYAFTGGLSRGILMILTLVAAVAVIFSIDWKLAIVALAGTPLFFITGHYFGPPTARASLERQQNLAEATSTVQENLGAQFLVRAFGLQERVISDYTRNLNALFRSSTRLAFLSGVFGLSANTIASAIQLAILGVGGWLAIGNSLTVGALFAFLVLMAQIIEPMQSISGIIQSLQEASGSLDRLEELLTAEPAIRDIPDARTLKPLSSAIQFENVAFSYTGDQPTLHRVNLTIPAGASVALVGPSGCGKSTLLNLLLRFYDPGQGRVTFDGIDLREAALDSVRGQIGVVFQDNVLFDTTIRENIRLGKLDATDAEVEAAARAAEIHELIMSLPEGYDTLAGERGSRLSGGQRQRIAIARALIRNPTILLLDEATSALDPRTEAAIAATLERIARERTTISVTHRLSSVVNADRIYVFDRGVLLEQGTHDELLQHGELYAQLWQEQSGARHTGVETSSLQGIPLFAHLDRDLLTTFAQRLLVERYAAGDVIITQGDSGDKLYIIARGQVDVLAADPAGSQRMLATLGAGAHFGEMALLYDMPRTATIRARTPLQLYSLSKDDFNELLVAVPGLRERLEHVMAGRARTSTEREDKSLPAEVLHEHP